MSRSAPHNRDEGLKLIEIYLNSQSKIFQTIREPIYLRNMSTNENEVHQMYQKDGEIV